MNIGLTAVIKTKLDEGELRRETTRLKEKLNESVEISPPVSTGALDRQLADWSRGAEVSTASSRVGALANAFPTRNQSGSSLTGRALGAAGSFSRDAGAKGAGALEGALAAGGAGRAAGLLSKLVTPTGLVVAAGGALFVGMAAGIAKLAHEASPALQKVTEMFGIAMKLFFRPLGTWAASYLMPLSKSLLQFATSWNKWYAEGGLAHAVTAAFSKIFNGVVDRFAENARALLTGRGDEQDAGAAFGSLLGGGIGLALGGPVGMAIGGLVGNTAGQVVGVLIEKIRGIDWKAVNDTLVAEATGLWAGMQDALSPPPWDTLISPLSWGDYLPTRADFERWFRERIGLDKPKESGPPAPTDPFTTPEGGAKDAAGDFSELLTGKDPTAGDPHTVDDLTERGRRLYDFLHTGTALASGGLVTRPTQALVGEAGDEAVIPLDRFEDVVRGSVAVEAPDTGIGDGVQRSLENIESLLSGMGTSLNELLALAEEGGDISLEVDGETLARTNENASDRFLSRRVVDR